ncbi:Endonuclease HJR/Mrr/RecB family [Methanonatronarchaeum thermophilum]|uniref:Endonuclease HJR/Mrr/RecB family n=1 Tax=Methanonatronarchaeum thermophilum TaxID=1927129 RepID=A0A1Y3GBS9_9EURY|nr:hypothetical protein [Methanonatronarchaeum thermophilum]OUJ18700.1 Endonuclease HJR/Mrr/RecB family [Methanonatronarchaeum thermophilum]
MGGTKPIYEVLSDILEIHQIEHEKQNNKITFNQNEKQKTDIIISKDIIDYKELNKIQKQTENKILAISMNGFTEGALELSKINKITLWDQNKLQKEIGKAVLTELDFQRKLDLKTPENIEIAQKIDTKTIEKQKNEKSSILDILGSTRTNKNQNKKQQKPKKSDNGRKPKQKTTKEKQTKTKETETDVEPVELKKELEKQQTQQTEDKQKTNNQVGQEKQLDEERVKKTDITKYCLDMRINKKDALRKSGMVKPIKASITLEPYYKFQYKVENSEYLDEIETSQEKTIYVDGDTGELTNLPRENTAAKRPIQKEEEKKFKPNINPKEAEKKAIEQIKNELVKRARYGGIRYSTTKKFHSDFDKKDQFNIKIQEKTLVYRPIWNVKTEKGQYTVDAADGKVISGTIDDGVMFI